MRPLLWFPFSVVLFSAVGVLRVSAGIERSLDKTFDVAPGSIVKVEVSGAAIRTTVGPAGSARVVLKEKFRTDDPAEADRLLERYDILCEQQGEEVKLVVRVKRGSLFAWRGNRGVAFAPEITVPADVRLDLDTSGGSIRVGVDPAAKLDIEADTSGGRVQVDGFADFVATKKTRTHVSGTLNGGGGRLRADTSGGSIRIGAADRK